MFLGVRMISSLIEEEVGGDVWLSFVALPFKSREFDMFSVPQKGWSRRLSAIALT